MTREVVPKVPKPPVMTVLIDITQLYFQESDFPSPLHQDVVEKVILLCLQQEARKQQKTNPATRYVPCHPYPRSQETFSEDVFHIRQRPSSIRFWRPVRSSLGYYP